MEKANPTKVWKVYHIGIPGVFQKGGTAIEAACSGAEGPTPKSRQFDKVLFLKWASDLYVPEPVDVLVRNSMLGRPRSLLVLLRYGKEYMKVTAESFQRWALKLIEDSTNNQG